MGGDPVEGNHLDKWVNRGKRVIPKEAYSQERLNIWLACPRGNMKGSLRRATRVLGARFWEYDSLRRDLVLKTSVANIAIEIKSTRGKNHKNQENFGKTSATLKKY